MNHPPNMYIPEDLWSEIIEFITGQIDTIDGADGQPEPNKAMILINRISWEVT